MDFIHLHNHTDYSVLDGAITVQKLVKRAVEMGMKGVAMTDHGNLFGAIEFYQEAQKNGIKPIVGQEFYIAPQSRFKKESENKGKDSSYHLLLLAKNETGYKNIIKLSSIGYTEGFYYKPRIDHEVLEKHSEGLICASACLKGEIPSAINKGKLKEAQEIAGKYKELFGKDNFYLEIQYHNIPEQKTSNTEIIKMSKSMDIPLIATNDCHYLKKEDAYSHEILLCIQTGKTFDDVNRMKFHSDNFYFKSPEEMNAVFPDNPEALLNTSKILEMIDLKLNLGSVFLPHFEVEKGYTLDSYLRHLVYQGAEKRYPEGIPDVVKKRIEYELQVIIGMNFTGYFLIVCDFIKYAKKMKIPVGPGRGSATGSVVSYCLEITDIDPLKYSLLFERFLNPDRNEMPDIDVDFCAERREEVIDYVKKKYGEDHVSQINTFNRMTAKAVLKDVARVMNVPFAEANQVTKLIPNFSTLQEAVQDVPDFNKLYKENKEWKKHIDVAFTLEGLCRSVGKHAAGVVISRGPMSEHVPLYRDSSDGSISSQFEKGNLEKAGLVKMDFLGLKNLTIIDKCLKLIKKTRDIEVDITKIPMDDKKTFSLLQNASTNGIFQLESAGMQKWLRELGPTVFEDIIAMNALYRPGPMDYIPDFVARKRNPKKIKYFHPLLEPILKDTLGVIVYQEQVMQISQVMGGFSMPDADKLRKAMGKKIATIVDSMEEKFLKGAKERKIDAKIASEVYNAMKEFSKYGFNKSHSAAYALISYQTAYLKANYTIEYMATLLSSQPDKQDDVIQYVNDCKTMGIQVLPPDINTSEYDFTVEGPHIRFGLGAIKGLGSKVIDAIVTSRYRYKRFNTLKEFLENIDLAVMNKGVLESLIKSGALDPIFPNRAMLFNSIDLISEIARNTQMDKETGQANLFESETTGTESGNVDLPETADWTDKEKLSFEKEILGVFISGHPLDKFMDDIAELPCTPVSAIDASNDGDTSIAGIITNLKVRTAKNGKMFAVANIEDTGGVIEALFFPQVYEKYGTMIESDEPMVIKGRIDFEDEAAMKIVAKEVKTLKEIKRDSISGIHIKFNTAAPDEEILKSIKVIIVKYGGNGSKCPVYFHLNGNNGSSKTIRAHNAFNTTPSEKLKAEISALMGADSVYYTHSKNAQE